MSLTVQPPRCCGKGAQQPKGLLRTSEHLQQVDLGGAAQFPLPGILHPGSIDPQQLQGAFDGNLGVCSLDQNQTEIRMAAVFRQPPGIRIGRLLELAPLRQISRLHQERILRACTNPAFHILTKHSRCRDEHQ